MNKFLHFLFFLVISFNLQAKNICKTTELTIGFFNGVFNTAGDAKNSKDMLASRIEDSNIEIDEEKTKYEIFYNDTNGWLDLIEVFEQKLVESYEMVGENLEGRYELFFDFIVAGYWAKQLQNIAKANWFWLAYSIIATYISNTTEKNYQEHRQKITDLTTKGQKLMFVAHSQGNLFVNEAYKYAINQKGYSKSSVKVVHVAPASWILNGEQVLIDSDKVIAWLQNDAVISDYFDKENSKEPIDGSGHQFINTYLNDFVKVTNQNGNILNSVLDKLNNAFISLENPNLKEEEKSKIGFFTALIEWNGSGDVDLNIYEPDGGLVNAWNKKGNSGELDIDNKFGFGPEHYYATCDSDKLQEGIYKIAVLNHKCFGSCLYKNFRTVNLIILDNNENILSKNSVILGNDKYLNRAFYLVDLKVSKDIINNKYSTEIIDDNPRLITDFISKEK